MGIVKNRARQVNCAASLREETNRVQSLSFRGPNVMCPDLTVDAYNNTRYPADTIYGSR